MIVLSHCGDAHRHPNVLTNEWNQEGNVENFNSWFWDWVGVIKYLGASERCRGRDICILHNLECML